MSDVTAVPGFTPARDLDPRECPTCGRTYRPYRASQRACSRQCRERVGVNPQDLMPVEFICVLCDKPSVGFSTGGGGHFKYCGDCRAQADRAAQERKNEARRLATATDPLLRRHKNREQQIRRYGITWEQYEQMLSDQGGVCAICHKSAQGGKTSSGRLHVDHDHSCCPGTKSCGECVRGLLCSNCNLAIGYFQDDPALLRAAVDYLSPP